MAIGRRIRDYFGGRRLSLATRLPPDEVEARINAAAASIFTPFATGVVGWARLGRVRLRYRRSVMRNDAKPVLAGRIRPDRGGSLLHLNYRAPLPLVVFFPLWYAILALMAGMFLASALRSGTEPAPALAFAVILTVMLILPVALIHFGLARADAELEELLAFLRTSLSARDSASGGGHMEAGR